MVLAAGLGSRYGGLKQLDPIGPGGELILDYAVYDAARAGVDRVVFVIRPEMEAEFHRLWGHRYTERLDVAYALQRLEDLPAGFIAPPERSKPWGTAHAVFAARGLVRGPFLAANADDFYGAPSYQLLVDFLRQPDPAGPTSYAMAAFELGRTLSEHGAVSRGVCAVDAQGLLASVREQTAIEVAREGGALVRLSSGKELRFSGREPVSLNLWGLQPTFFLQVEECLERFLAERGTDPKAEMYLPSVVDELVAAHQATVRVLHTPAHWFGVTYRQDRPRVAAELAQLTAAGHYPLRLWP